MEAYKFETTVLENGMIKVPQFEKYTNRKIEVFVVFLPQIIEKEQKTSIDGFLKKWTGFAKGIDQDTEKYDYLMAKYK
ncbi:MAG: hypothetical protein DRJ05_11390 [Bacteroidetes bacterium]|nr:MAG: hypothetical protein DRJ05_11390 [Bacteroidota bacterium]